MSEDSDRDPDLNTTLREQQGSRAALDKLAARIAELEGALKIARGQIVAFSLDTITAEQAVKNVAYIDDALTPDAAQGEG